MSAHLLRRAPTLVRGYGGPQYTKWPVFLVGCHRSGTTLTRYLLDAHPNLACPPESKFIAGFDAFLNYPQSSQGLRSLGVNSDELLLEFGRIVRHFMGRYAKRQGKSRWVDKTPNYYRILPLIDAMLSGQVLYLLIVRYPLDTIESLAEAPPFTHDRLEDPDIERAVRRYGRHRSGWAKHWVDVNRTALGFLATTGVRHHVLRYEDLVQSPKSVLRDVLRFLGERMPEDLVDRAFSVRYTDGYRDWKLSTTTSIHQSSLGRWRGWPSNEVHEVWEIVADTARTFGYDPPD